MRHLILAVIGVRRIAEWCDVTEGAVHQWLSRATDEKPLPRDYVPAILAGAKRDGVQIDLAVLWPALGDALTEPRPGNPQVLRDGRSL